MAAAEPLCVLLTGAAASVQFASTLLDELSQGKVFGLQQPLCIHILDELNTDDLKGVVKELLGYHLPLVHEVSLTDDSAVAYKDVEVAFLVGGMPYLQGMDRKHFLAANVEIFKAYGRALDQYAKKSVKVLVAGHEANTHVFICSKYAPSISPANFSATIRLDENYAQSLIATRLDIAVQQVEKVIIWGNHSSTLFPDVSNATVTVDGTVKSVNDAINDQDWITGDFISIVQKRGADYADTFDESAAMAAADQMKDWWNGTGQKAWVSMAVISDGSYNILDGVVFSFPVRCSDGQWRICQGLRIDEYTRGKLDLTAKELREEREEILAVCHDLDDTNNARFGSITHQFHYQQLCFRQLMERSQHLQGENELLKDQLNLKDSEIAQLFKDNEILKQYVSKVNEILCTCIFNSSNCSDVDLKSDAHHQTIAQCHDLLRSLSINSKHLEEQQQRKRDMEFGSAGKEETASHNNNNFLMSTPALAATERDSPGFTPIIRDGSATFERDDSAAVTSRSRSSELISQEERIIRMPVFDESRVSEPTIESYQPRKP